MDSTSLGQVALHSRVCRSGRIYKDMSANSSASVGVQGSSAHCISQDGLSVGAGGLQEQKGKSLQ